MWGGVRSVEFSTHSENPSILHKKSSHKHTRAPANALQHHVSFLMTSFLENTVSLHVWSPKVYIFELLCPLSGVQCPMLRSINQKSTFYYWKNKLIQRLLNYVPKSRNAWSYIKRLDCVGFLDFYLGNFFLMNKIGHKNWINIDTLRRVYCEAFPKST